MVPAVQSRDASSRVHRRRVIFVRKPAAWHCETAVGVFSIAPSRSADACWELWIDTQCLGTYESVGTAADDVERCATGDIVWDDLERLDRKATLGKWKMGPAPKT